MLRLLATRPMHGYEVVRAIRLASDEQLDFGEGCIYPVLHRLERGGILASAREPVNGRTRIVYRLTPVGEARLRDSSAAWAAVVRAVARILEGGGDGDRALA
ncbi:MAG: PadR family transcriptional regulator [Gemmataceae bacterium]